MIPPMSGPSARISLDQQRRWLAAYEHLERFGGRYQFVLARIYQVSRTLVVSILNDYGDIHADRTDLELFVAAAMRHPDHASRLGALVGLRGFTSADLPDPFDPVGEHQMPTVAEYRDMAIGLLGLAVDVRMRAAR